jgi:hypothetical protein
MFRLATSGFQTARLDPLLDGHIGGAAGRQVHDHVGSLLDDAKKRLERFRRLVRSAVLWIAGVKMHDRSAGFGGTEGGFAISAAVTGR